MAVYQPSTAQLRGQTLQWGPCSSSLRRGLYLSTTTLRPGRSSRRSPSAKRSLAVCSSGGTSQRPTDIAAIDVDEAHQHQPSCKSFDFLVIGSGIAGLTYALKVAQFGTVAVVSPQTLANFKKKHCVFKCMILGVVFVE